MQFLTSIMNILAEVGQYNEFFKSGMAYIGAAIAVFTGVGAAIGEGNVAAKAVEAIGRQPEAAGSIRLTMLIGQAVSETTGLYGFIIALMLLGK
ncbi:MAG: ATP synthase F0 subunit C [Anaeroplasmataceae bacterium]|jgi:ATP synthase, F0 subunit c|nr:ATP synthase F0 subunit C [Anaeroplasmataceae bacterium]HRF70174.1 ATP synthase F0 subunit C [Candidatus Pelethenecus sp.]